MQRLQVSVMLSGECTARACRLEATAGGRGVAGACELRAEEVRWLGEGQLIGVWLAPGERAGWLEEEWKWTWHLRGGLRVEAVLPGARFGEVVVRALTQETAGQEDGTAAVEECVVVNDEPARSRRVRWLGWGVGVGV